jgi:hypothetical protein
MRGRVKDAFDHLLKAVEDRRLEIDRDRPTVRPPGDGCRPPGATGPGTIPFTSNPNLTPPHPTLATSVFTWLISLVK